MVIIVKGTIGNLNNVLRHTENNRSKENDRKRKFIQDDIQLTFPIHLNGIQAHHEHVLKAFTQGEHDDITIDWEFSDQTEALLARMIARSSMVILWENKWRISKEEIYQQKITNERELLIAIVLGISQRWIETNHVHLEWKNGLWMRLSFGVDPERMDELVFTKDQRNESLDAFFLALQPPVTNLRLNHYVSDKMQSNLSPFQTQNVEWMLKREGHYADHQGFVLPFASVYQKPPLLHTQINGLIINQANDRIVTDQEQLERLQRISYRGGILADEMGLGKTVCVIALITKHMFNKEDPFYSKIRLSKPFFSSATLIITPNMIVSQWISEFKKHAPSLRYYIYKGRNKGDTIDTKGLAKYDVVLSDYETLKTEINHSIPSPNRPRRKAVKYGYSQSPLVTTFWFRCVLDEAQMIESNTSKITKMAKRIPHYYSWAVSGTPMKKNYTDLYTLYDFLKLEKTLTPTVFSQFVKKRAFMEFAKETIRRNTKRYLDSQVQIPPQYRHVVLVPFSTIEQHYYQDLWRQCRQEIDLDWLDRLDWVCPTDQIDRYNSALSRQRSWLLALRQSCIHPSVIINPSYRLIKTNSKIQLLSEVLVDMGRDAQDTLDDHQYAFYKSSLRLAGMHEVLELFESAVEIYTSALVPVLSLEQAHGKAVQRVENMRDEGNENNLSSLKNKHQRWLLLLHQFYFYAAGVSHVLKREAEEEAYYGQADALREKMLRKSVDRVESAIEEVNKSVQKGLNMKQHEAGSRHLNINLALLGDNGKHTKNVIENVNKIGIVLDRQLKRMNDLKNKALPILTKSLAEKKEKDAPTGDEYAVSLSEQELCQVYLDAYNELLKDRNFIVKGTTSSQSDQERENDKFMSEEAKLVKKTETEFRSQITSLAGFRIESLKDTEQHLRILKGSSNLSDYVRDLQNESVWIRELLLSQEDLLECLDNDARKLSSLLNARISYYRKLQIISNTLLEWSHRDPKKEIEELKKEQEKREKLISQAQSRDQYFRTLKEELSSTDERAQKDCMICQEPIEKGIITYCGHISCFDCGSKWIKNTHKCHTCNRKIQKNEWYTVSYKQLEVTDHNEKVKSKRPEPLWGILKNTNSQKIVGEHGAKLDSIIRHIQYIKQTTHGKCIVFSQFPKVIEMLKKGLQKNKINCMTLSNNSKKADVTRFQTDHNLTVILLHSKSHSSGLTLVDAHTVFIVEPVLNESLEKQAINRVHRIGQTHETNVFYYIIQDTIEERIHSIYSTRQGNQPNLLTTENSGLSVLSEGSKEIVKDDDLRRCFTQNESLI